MKKTISKSTWMTLLCTAALLVLVVLLENVLDPNKNIMVFAALKKGAVYALVAVSMNLLNGFTGLFSPTSPWDRRASCCWGRIPTRF